jgi:GT2 family glycosyltransferase
LARPERQTLLLTAVHYHDTTLVKSFVEHVCALARPDDWDLQIALSDNSSSWPTGEQLPAGVTVYAPGGNVGYLSGCAAALRKWSGDHGRMPEWVAVLNTDLELAPDFFSRLLQLDLQSDCAIIAPDVRLESGLRQNPYLRVRPSRRQMYVDLITYGSRTLSALHDRLYAVKAKARRALHRRPSGEVDTTRIPNEGPTQIYAPHGSAMFIRRGFFELGGVLEYRGFMYGEEMHVAEQARNIGLTVRYEPSLRVLHKAHATTGRQARDRIQRWRADSAQVIWHDYFSGKACR